MNNNSSCLNMWLYSIVRIPPQVVYPLDKRYRGREKKNRNRPARLVNVRIRPGPRGKPGGAVEFLGRPNSYVQIPNRPRGRLDTVNSITLLAWVLHKGRSGPIIHYKTNGWGPHLWMVGPRKLFVRFTNRRNLRGTRYLISSRYFRPRRWNFVGATYNGRNGIAKLFINNRFVTSKRVGRFKLATQFAVRLGARRGDRRSFRGRIACVQIYNRALTNRQIKRRRNMCFRGKRYQGYRGLDWRSFGFIGVGLGSFCYKDKNIVLIVWFVLIT